MGKFGITTNNEQHKPIIGNMAMLVNTKLIEAFWHGRGTWVIHGPLFLFIGHSASLNLRKLLNHHLT